MGSGTTFLVQWSKPGRPNGNITHYIVEVYNISDDCDDTELEMINRMNVSAPSGDHTMINAMIRDLGNVLCNCQTVIV